MGILAELRQANEEGGIRDWMLQSLRGDPFLRGMNDLGNDPRGTLQQLAQALGGVPEGVKLTPPAPEVIRDYTADMWPSEAPDAMRKLAVAQKVLTDKGASALGAASKGVIANTAPAEILDLIARAKGREDAGASALEKLARDTPASDLRGELKTRKAEDAKKPFYEKEGFVDGVLAWVAQLGADQGHGAAGKALQSGLKGRQESKDRGHKLFMDELSLGEKDLSRSDIIRKLVADAERARGGVGAAADAIQLGDLTRRQAESLKREEMANRIKAAGLRAPSEFEQMRQLATEVGRIEDAEKTGGVTSADKVMKAFAMGKVKKPKPDLTPGDRLKYRDTYLARYDAQFGPALKNKHPEALAVRNMLDSALLDMDGPDPDEAYAAALARATAAQAKKL